MTTSPFTISHTIDQGIIDELEGDFDSFRARIAHLSLDATSAVTAMFQPLGPEIELMPVIDIDAMEWDTALEVEVERHEEIVKAVAVLELAAA